LGFGICVFFQISVETANLKSSTLISADANSDN
jgi:hypothetical protein